MGTRQNRLAEVVLTSTHNLCFEQKYEKYQSVLSENVQFLEEKFSRYLNRHVFVMRSVQTTMLLDEIGKLDSWVVGVDIWKQ